VIYPLTNILIDALPKASRRDLTSRLAWVDMPTFTSVYDANEFPHYAHFLTSGIASQVMTATDGASTEVATVGREGVLEGVHLMGSMPSPARCFMQIAGNGYRIELDVLQRLFEEDEAIRRVILAYLQYQTLTVAQIAGCNRLHSTEARLARWLLMLQDRTASSSLRLKQAFVGELIGSQRTTVSELAAAFQQRGLIEYSRGTIRILDRSALEETACECYPITRRLLAGVYDLANQPLYREPRSKALPGSFSMASS
jgi:CRP-like cAMP-binding protein